MRISDISSEQTAQGGTRVEARVDGEPLWFASEQTPLAASAEGFASALLLAAAARGEALEIDAPLDRAWFAAVPRILQLVGDWWGYEPINVVPAGLRDYSGVSAAATAQCFTGGVDSYYALLQAPVKPQALVFVHGFDIALDDQRRLDGFLPGFRETAAAVGSQPLVIATNLRQHSSMNSIHWTRAHGGGLAALGHLLAPNFNRLVIGSSFPYHDPQPWGTRWDLDPLWSSSRMTIEHADATLRRPGKVRAIADDPLVRRHLRVCFENRTPTGNCSRCEKCVRTMLALDNCDALQDCATFDHSIDVKGRIDRLKRLQPHLISIYEDLILECDTPRTRSAVNRLIGRSRGPWAACTQLLWRIRWGLIGR